MRKISYNFLFIFGLVLVLGLGTAVSAHELSITTDPKAEVLKIPKNMSAISVETDEPMKIYIDGVEIGTTQGNKVKFEKLVTPGDHDVRIVTADGKEIRRTLFFTKQVRQCICLVTVRKSVESPCPYDISVSGPDKVTEGDNITFIATNAAPNSPNPINYVWRVSPAAARITSGLGTSSITVETGDLGGQNVTAEIEATDGFYDAQCRQRKTVSTFIERLPKIIPPDSQLKDSLVFRVFDDDKARLDLYAQELQNAPDAQGYVIMYQGPKGVKGVKFVDVNKMAKRSLDYLVKVRGIDPRRIVITNGGSREQTMGDLWIVPPGAQPPVPTPR